MNRTDAQIAQCRDLTELGAIRDAVAHYDVSPEKRKRFVKAIAHRRLEIELAIAENEKPRPAIPDPSQPFFNATQKPRWRKITKYDGEGNLLLVGYERRSWRSRKAKEVRWLREPKILQRAAKPEVATIVA